MKRRHWYRATKKFSIYAEKILFSFLFFLLCNRTFFMSLQFIIEEMEPENEREFLLLHNSTPRKEVRGRYYNNIWILMDCLFVCLEKKREWNPDRLLFFFRDIRMMEEETDRERRKQFNDECRQWHEQTNVNECLLLMGETRRISLYLNAICVINFAKWNILHFMKFLDFVLNNF